MAKYIRLLFAVMLMFAYFGVSALAQSTTDGAIGGVIRDAQGAVVVGARCDRAELRTRRRPGARRGVGRPDDPR